MIMSKGMPHPKSKKKTALGTAAGQASLDGIEVTQVVQDMNQSVPLVANKPTVVRVYLSRPSGGELTVRGEIAVRRTPTGAAQSVPSLNTARIKPAQNGHLRAKREDLRLSLNFRLPASLVGPGRIYIRLAGLKNAATGAPVLCADCGQDVTVEFEESAPLRIRLIRLRYKAGNPAANQVASAHDLALIKSWLRRAYPVAEVISSEITVDANFGPPFDREDDTNDCDDANAQISALRNLDISGGMDKRTHYYGLVADAGGFMRGCANAIPSAPNPAAVASGPVGPDDFGWDKDGSYGDWYTGHELGHTFGRKHIGSGCGETSDDPQYPFPAGQLSGAGGDFVGFDVGDSALGLKMNALPGVEWHDVMSYCKNQWISSYTYSAILKRLKAEAKLGAGPVPAGDEAAADADAIAAADALEVKMESGNFINVVATVNLTRGTGKIKYVNPVSSVLVPEAGEESQVRIRVRAADGEVLREYPAAVKLNTCTEPGKDQKGVVDTAITLQPEARALELLIDGKTVDTYQAIAPPPEISNIRRRETVEDASDALSTESADNLVAFEWDVAGGGDAALADAATSNITYNVQVSTDGGNTWQTVAVGRTTPDATIDRSQFPDAAHIMVRVIATNGFDNSVATTDAIPVDSLGEKGELLGLNRNLRRRDGRKIVHAHHPRQRRRNSKHSACDARRSFDRRVPISPRFNLDIAPLFPAIKTLATPVNHP
jgi:hypothetical protein